MAIDLETQVQAARPLTTIFFLLDTSGSMEGTLIDSVNAAMRDAIPLVQQFAAENPDTDIRYCILEFSTEARWMTEEIHNVEDFHWVDLQASGLTALGAAYTKLNSKLSRTNGFLQEHANNAPIIILLTDGGPTDGADAALAQLKQNKWFGQAIKIALELPGSNRQCLVDFATEEGVIPVAPENLRALLRVVAVRSSTIGSKSQGLSSESVTTDIIETVKEDMESGNPFDDIFN